MSKNNNGSIILIVIFAIVLVGLGAAGYFVFRSKSEKPIDVSTSNNVSQCDTDKCFQDKFIKCEPASLQQRAIVKGGSKAYYEIVGGDASSCKMLYRDDSDNLELICEYEDVASYDTGEDNEFSAAELKMETDIGFGKETTCTGPKVKKLKQLSSVAG